MGRLSFVLFDPDAGYIHRLAAGLKNYLPAGTSIYVFSDEARMLACEDDFQDAVFCCGSGMEISLKESFPHSSLYYLQGEEENGRDQEWDKVIFKYQSVRKIAAQIAGFSDMRGIRSVTAEREQVWYGVFSPCHHENAQAFAITLAQILGNRTPALLILFAEFTGIGELFDIPQTAAMEQLVLRLRKNTDREEWDRGYVFKLGEASVLCLPENPSVLYELTDSDIKNLEYFIREETGARAVVWFLGSLFRFGMDIMKNCQKVFCLEKRDVISRCLLREFYEFVRKGYGDTEKDMPERLELPELSFTEKGDHLLWQWKNSVMGEEIYKRIGEDDDQRI